MPLQNRVTPFGDIEASSARGTLMGNRGGVLHETGRCLGPRRWRSKRWIACTLVFEDRRREIMAPGRYTELFFLDEAVALAAGHRPCVECRRPDFLRFAAAWKRARYLPSERVVRVGEIDDALRIDRPDGRRAGHRNSRLSDLPDGVMVSLPGTPREAWLVWGGRLHPWSHEGYRAARDVEFSATVTVLTPSATVDAIAAGYRPAVHASLGAAERSVRRPAPA